MSDSQSLTHLDAEGKATMVDVTDKLVTQRIAVAEGRVTMQPSTLDLILEGGHKKGDVFAVSRIAGIQAAKKCSDLIPLCHPQYLFPSAAPQQSHTLLLIVSLTNSHCSAISGTSLVSLINSLSPSVVAAPAYARVLST